LIYKTTPRGALAYLSPDEARLVDVVIRLHDLAHHRDPARPIEDRERGDMITLSLLHVGRTLCGFNFEALRDLASDAAGLDEPAALAELEKAVRAHLRRHSAAKEGGNDPT
jgi:hypothetical protein